MAVTAKVYGLGVKAVVDQSVNWASDTIRVALVDSNYTPNQDTDQFWSTPQAHESTGTGYSAGGTALASKTSTYDAATNEERLDAADVAWTTSTVTARYAVVYKDTGTAGTSALLGWVDFGADQSTSAGTFTLQWDATGVIKYVAA
jgi:hypothetical protein